MMNINDTEYGITVLALKGFLLEMTELQDDAMDEGNEKLEITLCAAERLIESALNIMEQQQEQIAKVKRAINGMHEERS
ncbi:TPA: hypothetical protein L7154_001672 [Escherichia coli]|uniref:hypothetical protein n=1 Tax=Escherichia coli TaxID=562 RepID=UPI00157CD9F3|nr:hypothetical protein [Escherichia coli]NUD24390.1 hypothetical protein [Escherichia coli]HBA4094541.1 hypothetical protein [Escherichia coli]HBQ4148221.1 hypothetical protein [Escherichia coli]